MAIILKANKVNFFVSSVLFVFWYHSPNVLDTPYICGGPCKARNFNVVYIYIYMDLRLATLKSSLSICLTMFQHRINGEVYHQAQLCVNTFLAKKVTLITDGI
jgi:hypothetical protein